MMYVSHDPQDTQILQILTGTKDTGKSNVNTSVADRVARGLNSINYTTRMYPKCFPLKNQ